MISNGKIWTTNVGCNVGKENSGGLNFNGNNFNVSSHSDIKQTKTTFIEVFIIRVAWKWKTVGDFQTFLVDQAKQNTLNQLTASCPFFLAVFDYFQHNLCSITSEFKIKKLTQTTN